MYEHLTSIQRWRDVSIVELPVSNQDVRLQSENNVNNDESLDLQHVTDIPVARKKQSHLHLLKGVPAPRLDSTRMSITSESHIERKRKREETFVLPCYPTDNLHIPSVNEALRYVQKLTNTTEIEGNICTKNKEDAKVVTKDITTQDETHTHKGNIEDFTAKKRKLSYTLQGKHQTQNAPIESPVLEEKEKRQRKDEDNDAISLLDVDKFLKKRPSLLLGVLDSETHAVFYRVHEGIHINNFQNRHIDIAEKQT